MKKEQAGLYVHIPFCLKKCAYCDFYSTESVHLITEFTQALQKEIYHYRNLFSRFDTIYFGGGTPSLLRIQEIEKIFSAISTTYTIDKTSEITIEINPGDASFDYLRCLRKIGFNRINIGIQSFYPSLLGFLGRRHSKKDAVTAIEDAKKAGFDNLGLDLIYGIRGQGRKKWENTLMKTLSFVPQHISCYQLSLHEKTLLHKKYIDKGWPFPTQNNQQNLFYMTDEILREAGYLHYEISNFASHEIFQSQHNKKYWRHIPYLGVGPSANSFRENKRWWNKPSLYEYLQKISKGRMPIENSEELTNEQLQLEFFFLGLRTREGIPLKQYKRRFGIDLLQAKKTMLDLSIKNNLLEIKNGFLRPTLSGMAVADSLALI